MAWSARRRAATTPEPGDYLVGAGELAGVVGAEGSIDAAKNHRDAAEAGPDPADGLEDARIPVGHA